MKTIFKNNLYFFIPYLIFIILSGVLLSINSKETIHLTFNSFHSHFFDVFFFYITYLGDGILAVLVVIMLLAVKYRYALIIGLSNIIASTVTQVLKQFVFSDELRPKKYFEGMHDLYFVPGVDNLLFNSFPSGHTTCAFSLYLSLTFIVKKKYLKFLFFSLALLTGYSRIYLSQHFLSDVFAGSLIGTGFTILVFYFVQNIQSEKLEHSLISLD